VVVAVATDMDEIENIKACLECSLPICNDKDVRCAFVKIVTRDGYHKKYYADNREREIARIRKWEQDNKEKRNAYRRDLRKRRQREARLTTMTSEANLRD
jgi:hypothetical protein